MDQNELCSVGSIDNNGKCDLNNIKLIYNLSKQNKELIFLRCNAQLEKNSTICSVHEEIYLHKYEIRQKKCCNLFNLHPNQIKKASLRPISISKVTEFRKKLQVHAIPGEKLCCACRKKAAELLKCFEEQGNDPKVSTIQEIDIPGISSTVQRDEDRKNVNMSLTSVGLSPIKMHGVTSHRKVSTAKRKLKQQ